MDSKPNLQNVTRGVELIKHEIHLQTKRIHELENMLVIKNQNIQMLEKTCADLERKNVLLCSSFNHLTNNS